MKTPLVIDSNMILWMVATGSPERLGAHRLIAPRLLWSEVLSFIHEAKWRREITAGQAEHLRRATAGVAVEVDDPPELPDAAWRIADELGWAKTYDAEFVALARIRGCRLVTVDARLRRGADRLGFVVGPTEL